MKNYSVKDLLSLFWKYFLVILVLAAIGGAAMGYVGHKKQHTTYTATRNVLITHNLSETTTSGIGEYNVVNQDQDMMTTYKEIVNDDEILSVARKNLPKSTRKNYTVGMLEKIVVAKNKPQSLVLTIEAKTTSKNDSVQIVNAVARAFKQELPSIQPGVGDIQLLSKATTNNATSDTKPHVKKYIAVGIALGGLVGLIISFLSISFKDWNEK
ncbi:chain-length determining protein [Lactobacillaceae bacterium 24-114]